MMHTHHPRHAQSAFTLIELVLVMTVLSIIGFIGTSIFSLPSYDIEQTSRHLKQAVYYARRQAKLTEQSCGVIGVSSTSYRVYCGASTNAIENPHNNLDWLSDWSDDFGTAALSGTPQAEFSEDGIMTTGTNPVFTLSDGTNKIELFIETYTGHVCFDRDDAGNC